VSAESPGRALLEAIAAHRSLAAAGSDADQVTQDVLATVAQRYFGLEESQALVDIAEQALVAARGLARLGGDREREGAGLEVDVLRADARAAADEVRLAEARNRLRNASLRLALTLELDPTVTVVSLAVACPYSCVVPHIMVVHVGGILLSALLGAAAARLPALR